MTETGMRKYRVLLGSSVLGLAIAAGAIVGRTYAADSAQLPPAVVGGKIGYVLATRHWAVFQEPGAKEVSGSAECPDGFNDGPREEFEKLYPDKSSRTVLGTRLAREGAQWFPSTEPEALLVFHEAKGRTAEGLNLDGKIGPNDFTSPDGMKGIDNQLYRAIGCISSYRGPNGTIYDIEDTDVRRERFNRFLIELSGVDSLTNDDDVTVKSYHGLDRLLGYTNGTVMPGSPQRIDGRWGKFAQSTWKGKIVNGVLTTEPADLEMPAGADFSTSGTHLIKGLRFQLSLTPEAAKGLMAGYVDVEHFYEHLNSTWATHFHSYGQVPPTGLYRALRHLADGYPDPKTGEPTAISSALQVTFAQAFIVHPPQQTSQVGSGGNASTAR